MAEPLARSAAPLAETEATTQPSEEQAVTAYRDFWDALVVASAEMDPDHPDLTEHATGQALELARHGVQGVADAGKGMEGAPELHPVVVSASPEDEPTVVEIEDCQGGGDWTVIGADEPESDNVLVTATVTRDVFDWWVTEMRIWGEDTC
ncbi:hypothetical protein ACOQFV_07640 [Nocardiopsis changdeensis]|uniref:Uncharacterized protein n=1 Tax=Nocardiopsis changdeensis TaxID=2831969 RepID=A0ABX8BIA1_9ACTN|nr:MULTISPECIES: hypothetical protein [Nocardiopsis]QUX20563.1 hypothetical protein KGD84_18825 [Nocardiopsis changdeensis]QYX36494.1 hypothetical protein K1J57_28280 [Nocardiopsis sp. MT53]